MYYRYRMNSDDQLRLVVRPRDGRWFNLHRDQLEHLWRDASPYATSPPAANGSSPRLHAPDDTPGLSDATSEPGAPRPPILGSGK